MNKLCILGATLVFTLFIVFLGTSLYVFSLSLSAILKYRTVSHINITNFFIDSIASVAYLLLSVMLLLVAGIAFYCTITVLFYCEEDYF